MSILLAAAVCLCGLASAATIPSSRTFIDAWRSAGYSGAIPDKAGRSVKDSGAVGDGTSDDTAAVRKAIDMAASDPARQAVIFPAGTYRLTSSVSLPSGVVLRGERGPKGNLARLRFDLGGSAENCINISGSLTGAVQPFSPQAIHSKWIDVRDGSGFAVGDFARVTQHNDPAWDFGNPWAADAVGQIVKITGISGNRLKLEQELRADYLAEFSPTIQKLAMAHDVGIDNLIIERADTAKPGGGDTIGFNLAANCWVRGCELVKCCSAHVRMIDSTKVQVTGCYFHDGFNYGGGGRAYGVVFQSHTGECLAQDNVFSHLRHSMLFQVGPNGNVLGYNYSRDATRTEFLATYSGDIVFHGNRPFANLAEGNIVCSIQLDASHGQPAGPYNTIFRNAATVNGIFMSSWSPQADGQAFVGNDIYAALLPMWTYATFGTNHFEHGNRIVSGNSFTVRPPTTDRLRDVSYYLSTDPLKKVKPDWWTIKNPLPTIGPGTPWQGHTNPAKARWDKGGVMTVGAGEPR